MVMLRKAGFSYDKMNNQNVESSPTPRAASLDQYYLAEAPFHTWTFARIALWPYNLLSTDLRETSVHRSSHPRCSAVLKNLFFGATFPRWNSFTFVQWASCPLFFSDIGPRIRSVFLNQPVDKTLGYPSVQRKPL